MNILNFLFLQKLKTLASKIGDTSTRDKTPVRKQAGSPLYFNIFRIRLPLFFAIIGMFFSNAQSQIRTTYDMNLELIPIQKKIIGKNIISILNNWDTPLAEIHLHNSSNGYHDPSDRKSPRTEILSVFVENREACVRNADSITMVVEIDPAAEPGDSVVIHIEFETKVMEKGNPFVPSEKNSIFDFIFFYPVVEYFYPDGWHPNEYRGKADPHTNFACYMVKLTVPSEFIIGASAHRVRVDTLKNNKIRHYFSYPKAISFNFAASPLFHKIQKNIQGIDTEILYLPKEAKHIEKLICRMEELVPFYTDYFGPCPNDKLLIAMGYSVGARAMATSNYIIFQEGFEDLNVLNHEFAHQWFGNAVNADESYETWLNESFAEFARHEFIRERKIGFPLFFKSLGWLPDFWNDIKTFTEEDAFCLLGDIMAQEDLVPKIYTPDVMTDWSNLAHMYAKYWVGSQALKMLKAAVGPKTMGKILQNYASRYMWQTVNTDSFVTVVAQISNQEIADNFRIALTTNSWPDFSIDKVKHTPGHDGLTRVTIEISSRGPWTVPVDVLIISDRGDSVRFPRQKFNGKTVLEREIAGKAKVIVLDPDHALLDKDRFNNRWPRKIEFQPLVGMPSSSSYKVYARPTLRKDWKEGWRFGLSFTGGILNTLRPVSPGEGRYNFLVEGNYGLVDGLPGYRLGYSTPFPGISYARIGLNARVEHNFKEARAWFHQYVGRPHYFFETTNIGYHRYRISLGLQQITDPSPSSLYSRGKVIYSWLTYNRFRSTAQWCLYLLTNIGGGIWDGTDRTKYFAFQWFDVELEKSFGKSLFMRHRWLLGAVQGDAPTQGKIFFSRSDAGPLLVKEMTGAMRGYKGSELADRTLLGYHLALGYYIINSQFLRSSLMIFFDSGLMEKSFAALRSAPMRSSGGMGLESRFLKYFLAGIYFPFWVSHPMDGQKLFKFRINLQLRRYF